MKILLLNDNPVVNKLVTLSAQKTSDDLEVVATIDSIESSAYDLLVIDDTLYSDELFEEIKEKITFTKSLYICARDTDEVDAFTDTLRKPFLPTELVEIFAIIGKESESIELSSPLEEMSSEDANSDEFEVLEDLEELQEIDEVDSLDELNELDDLDDELEELDELDDETDSLEDDSGKSILDDEEAQKVKDLLDETEEELELDDLDLEDDEELDLDGIDLDEELELESEEELELEEETPEVKEEELELDDLDLEDDEELELEEDLELDSEEETLEAQIESAVDELSEEELQSEVDAQTLLDIVQSDMNVFDGLTSKDLKIAIGEEVEEEEQEIVEENSEEEIEEVISETDESEVVDTNGVDALKKLLAALSDKDVAASMKGMKISINITLGDQ